MLPQEHRYDQVIEEERRSPNSVVDAARIVRYCKQLVHGRRFLDVGAGYGFFSRCALDNGFDVVALEPTALCRDVYERMNGLQAVPDRLTPEFVNGNKRSFDVVLLSQVLEHIGDLEGALSHIGALLRPNGIAVIAVPHFGSFLSRLQGKRDMFIAPPEHLNFFSKRGLKILFGRYGLTCCEIHTISRLDVRRVARRCPISILGIPASRALLGILRIGDHLGGGMFINGYFRKQVT